MRFTYTCVDDDGKELLLADISSLPGMPPDAVEMVAVIILRETGDDHIYTRTLHSVNTLMTNALGILQIALDELPKEALEVERPDQTEAAVSSDLAGRLERTLREVQAGIGELYSDRPSLRSGQSEQHGSDSGG